MKPDVVLRPPGMFVPRALVYVIAVLLATAAAWACLAEVDLVVSAVGRLGAHDHALRLSPPYDTLVRAVRVRVGDRVAAGDLLVEFDSDRELAACARCRAEIEVLRCVAERYHGAAAAARAVDASLAAELERLEQLVDEQALACTRSDELAAQGIASAAQCERERKALADRHVECARARTRRLQLAGEIAAAISHAAEAEARQRPLEIALAEAGKALDATKLRAPQAGTVVRLLAQQPGIMLSGGAIAVELLPDGAPLLACVSLPNSAVRRVEPGDAADVEFAAFPPQQHGFFAGRVGAIDPDAEADGAYRAWIVLEHLPAERPGLELVAHVRLERLSPMALLVRLVVPDREGLRVSR